MNRVVLAVNDHPDYQFLAPLTALLWATRTGYKPLVFGAASVVASSVMMPLENAGLADLVPQTLPNDRLSVKLVRWSSFKDVSWTGYGDDAPYLLLMDVDLWPISREFWDRPAAKRVTCFYGDAFQGKRHCTAGFRARADALQEISPRHWRERLEELRKLPEDDERRHSDDAAQSELVLAWMAGHPNDYELVSRGPSPPKDRIDRSAWPETFDLAGKVDAHLPRDASDRRVWLKIKPLFDLLAPDWAGWAKAYRDAWERQYA